MNSTVDNTTGTVDNTTGPSETNGRPEFNGKFYLLFFNIWVDKFILTPPIFVGVPVPSQKGTGRETCYK